MKELMLGNKAVARGLYEAGCMVVSSYPGTPSTEITEETAKYDGNVGLAAHNRGNKYSYFARINELEPGDEIVYTTKYGERKYIVDTKKEILETDWSNLEGTSDNRLTLITCIKNKVNQRLCVQAVQENI